MKRLGDEHLKFYTILVDQLHKYAAIFWQFPTALLVANLFALEKFFNTSPAILLLVSTTDYALIYAFHRLMTYQRAIIKATQKIEQHFLQTQLGEFVPHFSNIVPRATTVLVATLYLGTTALFVHSLICLPWACFFEFAKRVCAVSGV